MKRSIVALLILLLPGCSGSSREAVSSVNPSAGLLRPNFVEGTKHPVFPVGVVVMYSAEGYDVVHPMIITGIAPMSLEPGLELLDARVAFLRRKRDGFGLNGYPSTNCLRGWPPSDYGPTFSTDQLGVEKGDSILVFFYLRAVEPGTWRAQGVKTRVRIFDGDRVVEDLVQSQGKGIEFTTVDGDPNEGTRDGGACAKDFGSFGIYDEGELKGRWMPPDLADR